MDIRSAQRLLLAAGYYKGGIDGQAGPKTWEAVDKVISRHAGTAILPITAARWSKQRRMIAAAQIVLHFAGYEPGNIDGYAGHNTMNALRAWDHFQTTGKKEELPKNPVIVLPTPKIFPLQRDCPTFYGRAMTKEVRDQLVQIDLPFPMRLDWNLGQTVRKMTLHAKCADSASRAYSRILARYGYERLRELGLDRFAGSYAERKMRGSDAVSMHAYGCAIDHYAGPNGLTTRCPTALFCGKDYAGFFDIWQEFGWVSLGRAIGRDWMHVQAARLS